jgi:aspartyl-tRNA(Asn)/glutamyl-tRNA(Gln) amidotransferase subunit B
MEEDAGKSIHDLHVDTLVDVNRCGVPLIEIVSEPDIRSPREAYLYLSRMRQMVTYLGICDGNMEEGSLRCDANVSVRRKGTKDLGTKTEVKNMNSFRNVERALAYEIIRQIQLIEDGGRVMQETLLWDADRNIALPMRTKEGADDYRYFPEPDLAAVEVNEDWIAAVRRSLPELPAARRDRFVADFALPRYDADVLTTEKDVADYFEEALGYLKPDTPTDRQRNAKTVSNWVMTEVLRVMSEQKIPLSRVPVTPIRLASMIGLIENGTISGKIAKTVFEEMLVSPDSPETITSRKGLVQVSDAGTIEKVVDQVIGAHPTQARKYLDGNEKVFAFFVGETMKIMKGKGNPRLINEMLTRKLHALKDR